MKKLDVQQLLKNAKSAVEEEIVAVRATPSREMLICKGKSTHHEADDKTYIFDSQNPSFQHIDELSVLNVEKPIFGVPVHTDEKQVHIKFDAYLPEPVIEVEVEWVNDFVLTRTLEQLESITRSEKAKENLEAILVNPSDASKDINIDVLHDGLRNEAQCDAIEKSLKNRVTFVWGPPGTGKTATLGFIIANYLLSGMRVLFASNTNRAVDVGLISAIDALLETGHQADPDMITRFGDTALDSESLQEFTFEKQIEEKRNAIKNEFMADREDIRKQLLEQTIQKLKDSGKKIPNKLQYEYDLLKLEKVDEEEEEDKSEKLVEELEMLTFKEIRRKKLVATTLARVCTSDLLNIMSFDAVVIDEASMVNLPYILVLAAKSKKHIVFAGDPMQLPPIASTDSEKHREMLEQDIYTLVSGAKTLEDLFVWKDANEQITCFFDTQYRLNDDMATVISEVFYSGRLKTGKKTKQRKSGEDDKLSYYLVDSSRYQPVLALGEKKAGFRPENDVHKTLLLELVKRLVFNEQVPPREIGVIVPFRSVVWKYRKELYAAGYAAVEVGTIHTFQGREKDVILFDTIMSGAPGNWGVRHFSVRPFDETKNGLSVPRLLNVALSRARERLVVLADMNHVNRVYSNMFLGNLLNKLGASKK